MAIFPSGGVRILRGRRSAKEKKEKKKIASTEGQSRGQAGRSCVKRVWGDKLTGQVCMQRIKRKAAFSLQEKGGNKFTGISESIRKVDKKFS